MARVYGFGIIGTGVICDNHALALSKLEHRARLIAAADIDEDKLRAVSAKHFVPHTYTDYRKLLRRDDIDVVTVATPPVTHEELVMAALEAGKYVICEKPLAPTLEAADRIIDAARQYPNKLAVVHQQRFLPEVQKTVWLRDGGWLGELQFVSFKRLSSFAAPGAGGAPWWGRWQVAGGGVVMTQFIHELDLMIHILGTPVEVSGVMATLQQDIESEDTFAATIRFENGAIGSCCSTLNSHKHLSTFDVVGSRASVHSPWELHANADEHHAKMHAAIGKSFPPDRLRKRSLPRRAVGKVLRKLGWQPRIRPEYTNNLHVPYVAAFLDAIETGCKPPVTPEESRVALELCAGIYTSALTNGPVSLPLGRSSVCYRGVRADDYNTGQRVSP